MNEQLWGRVGLRNWRARTTALGATWPFPVGLAKVGNPHPNQTVQKSTLSERYAGPNSFGFFVA